MVTLHYRCKRSQISVLCLGRGDLLSKLLGLCRQDAKKSRLQKRIKKPKSQLGTAKHQFSLTRGCPMISAAGPEGCRAVTPCGVVTLVDACTKFTDLSGLLMNFANCAILPDLSKVTCGNLVLLHYAP